MLGLPVNTRAPPRSTRRALSFANTTSSSWTASRSSGRRYFVLVLLCVAGALVISLNARSAKRARLERRSLSRPRTSSGSVLFPSSSGPTRIQKLTKIYCAL